MCCRSICIGDRTSKRRFTSRIFPSKEPNNNNSSFSFSSDIEHTLDHESISNNLLVNISMSSANNVLYKYCNGCIMYVRLINGRWEHLQPDPSYKVDQLEVRVSCILSSITFFDPTERLLRSSGPCVTSRPRSYAWHAPDCCAHMSHSPMPSALSSLVSWWEALFQVIICIVHVNRIKWWIQAPWFTLCW